MDQLLGQQVFFLSSSVVIHFLAIPTESNSDPLPPIVDLETNEGIPADSPLINDTDPKSSKEEIEVHLTWKETLKISATFCPIWFIANYGFFFSFLFRFSCFSRFLFFFPSVPILHYFLSFFPIFLSSFTLFPILLPFIAI